MVIPRIEFPTGVNLYDLDGVGYVPFRDRLYRVRGTTANPRQAVLDDRVIFEGEILTPEADDGLVTFYHRNAGIRHCFPGEIDLPSPALRLSEVEP